MRIGIVFLFLIIQLSASAQDLDATELNEKLALLTSDSNDTAKAKSCNQLLRYYLNRNLDSAELIAAMGLKFAKNIQWHKAEAVFTAGFGEIHSSRGFYDSAMFYYELALRLNLKHGEKRNAASTYNNMASAASNLRADYNSAATYFFKALELAEEVKDSLLIATCLHNISGIYLAQEDFDKALRYENKAFALAKESGNTYEMANSLITIGKIRYSLNYADKGKVQFEQALSLYTQSGNIQGMANAWSAIALGAGNDYQKVIEARLQSKELWDRFNPLYNEAIVNTGNLGIAYLDAVRYDTLQRLRSGNKAKYLQLAEQYLKRTIQYCEQTGDEDNRSFFNGSLSEFYDYTGDYKKAYYHYRVYSEIQDSLYSQENKNKIAAAENQKEIDKRETEIKLKQLTISSQQKTVWILAGGLSLLGIIGFLFYKQSKARKKSNEELYRLNQELDSANKIKAKFFGILSHDLRGPIARLINFLHLQNDAPELFTGQEAAKHQQKIATAATSLLSNMENMLLWSKSQMELFSPVNHPVETEELFGHIRSFFNSVENISFRFEAPAGMIVNSDRNYVQTIMQNLTANAVQALQQTNNAEIVWKAWQQEGGSYLSISDNGPGMKAEIQHNFETGTIPFRGDTGLGLSIVKDMAKAINCKIEFQSNETGTIVILSFAANA